MQQTLQWDIRSHHQRAQGIAAFSVLLDGVRFRFHIDAPARTITVTECFLEPDSPDTGMALPANPAVATED